jgi:Domain of unknown function (DUF1937)
MNQTPAHLQHCDTKTIPGKAFVTNPAYPETTAHYRPEARDSRPDVVVSEVRPGVAVASFRPLSYLACPYSSDNPAEKVWRYEQATLAAAWLTAEQGLTVFSPITHSHSMHTVGYCGGDWEFWKKVDWDYLAVSKEVIVLLIEGWDKSVGIAAELKLARDAGMGVRYLVTVGNHYYFVTRPEEFVALPFKPSTEDRNKETQILLRKGLQGMRTFDTGATRDTDADKPDYEGFLSPRALEEFGKYMLVHQKQADGTLRTSDNWQKGIPKQAYIKSMWRHLFDVWKLHRGLTVVDAKTGQSVTIETALCALLFNVMGYLHETVKKPKQGLQGLNPGESTQE